MRRPLCFWCGRRVYLHRDRMRPDSATVDHIFHKVLYPQGRRKDRVLSCWACNKTRAVLAQRQANLIAELLDPSSLLAARGPYPCPECACPVYRRPGSFCSRAHWELNQGRLAV